MEGKEDDSNAIHEASEIQFKGLFYEILQYKTLRIISEGMATHQYIYYCNN